MEIATNAVLVAMLLEASAFVEHLNVPIQTPLQASNVVVFRTGASWNQAESDLHCYLAYKGGFEFRLSHGCINGFNTRASVSDLQNPDDLDKMTGEVRYSEAQCFEKAMAVFWKLGYSNLELLKAPPEVKQPIPIGRAKVPRYIFRWPSPGEPKFSDACIEVNASHLIVEHLYLGSPVFWRKSWPITLGTANTLSEVLTRKFSESTKPKELQVTDISRDQVIAVIMAILPEVSGFCSKLGPPFPREVAMSDISLEESKVSRSRDRLSASLRLKSGYGITFANGHVWAVQAPDAYNTSPWWRTEVRESDEYRDPTQVSAEEAIEKVRKLLLDGLHLDAGTFFLNTAAVFKMKPNPAATNGIRRYVFHWERPESPERRADSAARQVMPEMSVSAEVDAVSGDIKALNFFHRSLERADPKIALPVEAR